jgi:membrane protein YdbS with pleckstrin-like domain
MKYWVKQNSGPKGPFSETQIEGFIESGRLPEGVQVSESREGPWEPFTIGTEDADVTRRNELWDDLSRQMDLNSVDEALAIIDELGTFDLPAKEKIDLDTIRRSLIDESNSHDDYSGHDSYADDSYRFSGEPDSEPVSVKTGGAKTVRDAAKTGSKLRTDIANVLGNCDEVPVEISEMLGKEEQVYYAGRPSELILKIQMFFSWVAAALPILAALYGLVSSIWNLELIAAFIAVLILLVLVGSVLISNLIARIVWQNMIYMITSRRLITRFGVFNRKIRVIPIHNIQTITIDTGIIDRWLGFNKVSFRNSDWFGGVCFRHVDSTEVMKALGHSLGK